MINLVQLTIQIIINIPLTLSPTFPHIFASSFSSSFSSSYPSSNIVLQLDKTSNGDKIDLFILQFQPTNFECFKILRKQSEISKT